MISNYNPDSPYSCYLTAKATVRLFRARSLFTTSRPTLSPIWLTKSTNSATSASHSFASRSSVRSRTQVIASRSRSAAPGGGSRRAVTISMAPGFAARNPVYTCRSFAILAQNATSCAGNADGRCRMYAAASKTGCPGPRDRLCTRMRGWWASAWRDSVLLGGRGARDRPT